MCGIAGIWNVAVPRPESVVGAMLDAMAHRGPDGRGTLEFAGGAAGMVRLALVDLSPRGQQPLWSADRRVAILFNGEIYNFRQLRLAAGSRRLRLPHHDRHRGDLEPLSGRRAGFRRAAAGHVCHRDFRLAAKPPGRPAWPAVRRGTLWNQTALYFGDRRRPGGHRVFVRDSSPVGLGAGGATKSTAKRWRNIWPTVSCCNRERSSPACECSIRERWSGTHRQTDGAAPVLADAGLRASH